MKNLQVIEASHATLKEKHDSLRQKFDKLCDSAIETGWNYCPEKSSDFMHIPRLDESLVEKDGCVGNYILQKRIGAGQFSVVYSGFKSKDASKDGSKDASTDDVNRDDHPLLSTDADDLPIGAAVAIKSIDKRAVPAIQDIIRLETEIRALIRLRDVGSCEGEIPVGRANVVRFYEVLHGPRCLHLITECMPLDMYSFMQQFRVRINADVVAVLIRDVSAGLFHLQRHGICHRDIKPENLLVGVSRHDISVKICDMHLCAFVTPSQEIHGSGESDETAEDQADCDVGEKDDTTVNRTREKVTESSTILCGFVGSPGFFAPEILLQSTYCGFCADVFSLGCVALELLTKPTFFSKVWLPPYDALHTENAPDFPRMLRMASTQAVAEVLRVHSALSSATRNKSVSSLINTMLDLRPSARPTTTMLLHNTWLANADRFCAVAALNNRAGSQTVRVPGPGKMFFSPVGSATTSPQSSPFGSTATSVENSPLTSRQSSPLTTPPGSPLSSPMGSPRVGIHTDWSIVRAPPVINNGGDGKGEEPTYQQKPFAEVVRSNHARLDKIAGSMTGKYGGNVNSTDVVAPVVPEAPGPCAGNPLREELASTRIPTPPLKPAVPPSLGDLTTELVKPAAKPRRQSNLSNGASYAAAPQSFAEPGTVPISDLNMKEVGKLLLQRMEEKQKAFLHGRTGSENSTSPSRSGQTSTENSPADARLETKKERLALVRPSVLLNTHVSDDEDSDEDLNLSNCKRASPKLAPLKSALSLSQNKPVPFGVRIGSLLRRHDQSESKSLSTLRPGQMLAVQKEEDQPEEEEEFDLEKPGCAMSIILSPENPRAADLELAIESSILAVNTALNEVQRCLTPILDPSASAIARETDAPEPSSFQVRFDISDDASRVNSRRSSSGNVNIVLVPRSKKEKWSQANAHGSKSLSGRVVVDRFRDGIVKQNELHKSQVEPLERREVTKVRSRPATSTHDLRNPYLITVPHNEIHTHSAGMLSSRNGGTRKITI